MAVNLFLRGLILPSAVLAAPGLQNVTVTVPKGTSNHGDPHLLCTPTQVFDVFVFFLSNYIAHAATVRSSPGEHLVPSMLRILFALLFPVSGVMQGLRGIIQCGILGGDPLVTALRAGAVCEVVRKRTWQPRAGDSVRMRFLRPDEKDRQLARLKQVLRGHFEKADAQQDQDAVRVAAAADDLEDPPAKSQRQYSPDQDGLKITAAANEGPQNFVEKAGQQQNSPDQSSPNQSSRNQSSPNLIAAMVEGPDDSIFDDELLFIPTSEPTSVVGRLVHGTCKLPRGYALAIVPPDEHICFCPEFVGRATVSRSWISRFRQPFRWTRRYNHEDEHPSSITVSSQHSFVKALLAVLQLVYGSYSVY
ncbi:hypothetical protein VTK73DRAFT_7184 [Phialemonium thermophilum]|uniref:Uncharacterized protein n=1 Tax=Phialemonium thermophilum TaxID=223376 RepID=A0ABR3WFW9_9PEZI